MLTVNLLVFSERREASVAAAIRLRQCLVESLADHDRSSLLVSGGRSPADCLTELSRIELDWSRVSVALTDEREVPASHEASNAAMVQRTLIQGNASPATLMPCTNESLGALTTCAAALVGMGEDGHFASIFPDLPDLPGLLEPANPPGYHRVKTSASEYNRVTANLSLLLLADQIVLLGFGAAKRKVFEAPEAFPVSRLLEQNRVPVQIYWAP